MELSRAKAELKVRKEWAPMLECIDRDDTPGFFREYAKYLEKNNLVSASRIVLHSMIKKAFPGESPQDDQLEFDFMKGGND